MKNRDNWTNVITRELDCSGLSLGKAAQKAVIWVRGLDNVMYHPCNVNFVSPIVLVKNVEKSIINYPYKKYYSHSGFGGGFKVRFYTEMMKRNKRELFKRVCWGQMPKNHISKKLIRRIHVV